MATHALGDHREVRDDVLGPPGVLRAQRRILRGDAHRARVEVALAQHHASRRDQRRRRHAELLGAEQRGDDHVARGPQPAVDLHAHAIAQPVRDQHLLGLGEAELPRQTGVLQARQRRRAGAALVARDHHARRARLRDARRDRADAVLADQLDADPRVRVDRGEIVDELREILDRVDVVVRRRRDQRDAGRRAPHLRDAIVDLRAGQLTAFARLRALRDLDLQVVRVHQIVRGHAEPAGRDLLDRAAPPVAVRVGLEPVRLLAALAGVAPRAEAVHRDRERLVRLRADRAERHRAGDEPRHDRARGLDVVQRDRRRLAEVEQPAQRDERALLVVAQADVLGELARDRWRRTASCSAASVAGLHRCRSPRGRHW